MLEVKMLGGFSIRYGGGTIDDGSNRMRKVWLLLGYLIYTRNNRATQSQFLSLLRGAGNEEIEDPAGRMKALFYRVRAMLNQLGENLGHTLIENKGGSYCWNCSVPLTLDVEQFDKLCMTAEMQTDPEIRLQMSLEALELYKGDFLPKLSMEPWVMPIHAYYHQKYLDVVRWTLDALQQRSRWEEGNRLCLRALAVEPYSEQLYQFRMRCCLQQGNRKEVQTIYEEMSELLFDTFGVMPAEESRELYRQAGREEKLQSVPVDVLREQLQEGKLSGGALYCEYDFFKMLYQLQARSMARSGDVVHIALLSVHGKQGQELARKSLDTAMDNLQNLVLGNLRQGDVVTRCSVSQMIVMLPHANYENSVAVCQRVIRAFYRQFPHTPVEVHSSVQPLEPAVPDPGILR